MKGFDALVVLGARVLPDGRPSDALRYRVHTGVRLFHEGAAPLLLFTGAGAAGPPGAPSAGLPTEADVALRLATAQGVPEDRCLLERASMTTWENAAFSAPLLRERDARRVLVVTDRYHLFRALRCFWAHGIDAEGSPTVRDDGSLFVPRRYRYALSREAASLARRPLLLVTRPPRKR